MTERLYYSDSHMKEFGAVVLECIPEKKFWKIVLDRTAFFPEGGGQLADDGILVAENNGAEVIVHVSDAHEKGGIVYHYPGRRSMRPRRAPSRRTRPSSRG